MTMFISSGIAPLDSRIHGFVPGRTYLLSGPPGAGKGTACLEFINAGLQCGERGIILTQEDPTYILDSAAFIGIDLEPALLDDRLRIVTFAPDFVRRVSLAATNALALEELREHIGQVSVDRISIHSITPFLDGAGSCPHSMYALVNFLSMLKAAVLVSYPEDRVGRYDSRMDPMFHRAGGIFYLAADEEHRRSGTLHIRKLRHRALSLEPVRFRIGPGVGYTQDGGSSDEIGTSLETSLCHLEVVQLGMRVPQRLLLVLRMHGAILVYDSVRMRPTTAMRSAADVLVICARHDTLEDGLRALRTLRAADERTRVVCLLEGPPRRLDRMRAFRAGADEVCSLDISESEFAERLHALDDSGRCYMVTSDADDIPLVRQPKDARGQYCILDPDRFVTTVQDAIAATHNPSCTLLSVVSAENTQRAIAAFLMHSLRLATGDCVGRCSERVVVYLEGVLPAHLDDVVARIGRQWVEQGGTPFAVETIQYPLESERLRNLFFCLSR